VYLTLYIFYSFIENLFVVKYCTRLKYIITLHVGATHGSRYKLRSESKLEIDLYQKNYDIEYVYKKNRNVVETTTIRKEVSYFFNAILFSDIFIKLFFNDVLIFFSCYRE
jgi:hypothetical protein